MADEKKKQDPKNKAKADDAKSESSVSNLHTWHNLTEDAVGTPKKHSITGEPIILGSAIADSVYSKNLFAVNPEGNFNNPNLLPNQFGLNHYGGAIADSIQFGQVIPNQFSVIQPSVSTMYGADTTPLLTTTMQQNDLLLGTIPGKYPINALQHTQLLHSVGASIMNGELVVGPVKTWQELEREDRETELKKLKQEFEEKNQKTEDELKTTKEESAQKIRSLQDQVLEQKNLLAFIQKQLERTKKGLSAVTTKKGEKKGDIEFNRENGKVYFSRKFIGRLVPGTTDYYFFEVLFNVTDDVVIYENLSAAILKAQGKKCQGKPDPNYCQTLKSNIKKYAPGIAELIENSQTKDRQKGYRLICFKDQKIVRT